MQTVISYKLNQVLIYEYTCFKERIKISFSAAKVNRWECSAMTFRDEESVNQITGKYQILYMQYS